MLSSRQGAFGTPWKEQLIQFRKKAEYVCHTLGSWGAEYFVLESIKTLKILSDENHEVFSLWTHDERSRLVTLLGQDEKLRRLEQKRKDVKDSVSDKVAALLSFLETKDPSASKILIFVEQRVTANILSVILCSHPSTRAHFQCAPFVGLSNASSRKYKMPELLNLKAQSQALVDFRASGKNVIVATNALEEGIDVQTCNVVVCFDLPTNVRSFIQRRGRARSEKSVFVLFFEEQESQATLLEWQALERQLQSAYQDATREKDKETAQSTDQEYVDLVLRASSTGANLTANEAKAHLHHFCHCLPPQPYTDLRPIFSFERVGPGERLIRGTVTLPNCVDSTVRVAQSEREWETERAATIDAAFQCYKALYEARLLNENLLPVTHDIDLELPQFERLGAKVEAVQHFDPWIDVRQSWLAASMHYIVATFKFCSASQEHQVSMIVALPCRPPPLPTVRAFWDAETTVDISFSSRYDHGMDGSMELQLMRRITHLINRSTHSNCSTDERLDFLVLFIPLVASSALTDWLESNTGRLALLNSPLRTRSSLGSGFLRSLRQGGRPEHFQRWRGLDHQGCDAEIEVEAIPLTKRRNFAHPIHRQSHGSGDNSPGDENRQTNLYPAVECTIDRLPAEIARLNLLMPLILQHLQDGWMMDLFTMTVLDGIPCKDPELLLAALTPPALQLKSNYEALEFLGDSIVKLVVSVQLYEQHPNWPEGFLTRKRALLVSNEYLASAALAVGLPQFIRTTPNSWRRWSPIYISDLDTEPRSPRMVRTKLLADVMEALVGATFVDGGLEVARLCIQRLAPTIELSPPKFEIQPPKNLQVPNVKEIEAVVGYKFRRSFLLVEALTHPSLENDHLLQSYQRLEFLGDAVLDAIIASCLMQSKRKRSPGAMTRIKGAIANGHLLGFFCLDFAYSIQSKGVRQTSLNRFQVISQARKLHLWQLLRCHPEVVHGRVDETVERLGRLGPVIRERLQSSLVYPWTELTSLRPEKFFSDIIESLLGAIYVDSGGSLDECIGFLGRIGIMAYFRRLTDEDVEVVHPRTKLDWKTGSSTVDYKVTRLPGDGKYSCSIKLDDTAFLQVNGYESSDEAIMAASQAALLKLNRATET